MDIQIGYFDDKTLQSVTQYIDSKFLARGNATMIFTGLKDFLISLNEERNRIALSMDGPTVNWNVLAIVNDMRRRK